MNATLQIVVKLLGAAVALSTASGACAQSAGQWTAKLGVNKITPQVESGDVSPPALPGSKADVGSDTRPVVVFAYGLTDNISVELNLGVPYKHDIHGAGALEGTGVLGTVQALPPTAFVQYRMFAPDAMFRPYVGAGVTIAYFQNAKGSGRLTALTNIGGPATTFKVKNKAAGSVQAGLVVNMGERWFADVNVVKTFLKTKVSYSTGQYMDMTLNPEAVCLALGYKF